MKKVIVFFLIISIVVAISSCDSYTNISSETFSSAPVTGSSLVNSANTSSSQSTVQSSISSQSTSSPSSLQTNGDSSSGTRLMDADLKVAYNNIVISDKVPIGQIAEALGVQFSETGANITQISHGNSGKYDYSWNTLSYPSKKNMDMIIYYVINKTLKTTTLVNIIVYKGRVGRNISNGSSLSDLFLAYGNVEPSGDTSSTDSYDYYTTPDDEDYSISFIVDIQMKKVTTIYINYGSNKVMDELGLVSLVD